MEEMRSAASERDWRLKKSKFSGKDNDLVPPRHVTTIYNRESKQWTQNP